MAFSHSLATLPHSLAGVCEHAWLQHSTAPSLTLRHFLATSWSLRVCAVKAFSCFLAEGREFALNPTLSSCLAKTSEHMQSTHEMHLDHPSLVAKGAGIPGLHRTIMMRKKVFGRLPFSGHCTNSRLKHIPSLPVKRPIIYSEASDGRKGFMFPIYLEAIEVLLENINRETHFVYLLGLAAAWRYLPAYTLIWSPDFCNSSRGHLQISWLGDQQFFISAPQKCMYFNTLKAAAWMSSSQSVWK